jgi:hypothetical protein
MAPPEVQRRPGGGGAAATTGNEVSDLHSDRGPPNQAPGSCPPAAHLVLVHEFLSGLPCLIRRDAIVAVDCELSPRGIEALIHVRGADAPLHVREQADDLACELSSFHDRCRICGDSMPGTGKFGGCCSPCFLRLEEAL